MLKIKSIEFTKNVYDESMSHQIFSVANVYFSNYEPIIGALLYWRENKDQKPFTQEDEYKFFYDLSQTQFYASVKFPKYCTLSKDERQELAYILIEQRACAGSYSVSTNKAAAQVLQIPKLHKELEFPEQFDTAHFKSIFNAQYDSEINEITERYPFYTKSFIKEYVKWSMLTCKGHPENIKRFMPHIQMTQVCYQNPYLTESFLLDNLSNIDWAALQYNLPTLDRMTKAFRIYLLEQLKVLNATVQIELEQEPARFIEDVDFYVEDRIFYLEPEDDDRLLDAYFLYFEYDLGRNKWPGAEHLVKEIPSLACQLFDFDGDRKLTNKEMDEKFANYDANQMALFIGGCEQHWLNRYKKQIDWTTVCELNPHLTDDFIDAHLAFIDFNALANNTQCHVTSKFINKHFKKLSTQAASPLVLRLLNEELYETHKSELKLSEKLLVANEHILSERQMDFLESLLENE